jgi:hypothetical protein
LCRPELFKLTALHDVVPLAQIQLQVPATNWDEIEEDEAVFAEPSHAGATSRAGVGERRYR